MIFAIGWYTMEEMCVPRGRSRFAISVVWQISVRRMDYDSAGEEQYGNDE